MSLPIFCYLDIYYSVIDGEAHTLPESANYAKQRDFAPVEGRFFFFFVVCSGRRGKIRRVMCGYSVVHASHSQLNTVGVKCSSQRSNENKMA